MNSGGGGRPGRGPRRVDALGQKEPAKKGEHALDGTDPDRPEARP